MFDCAIGERAIHQDGHVKMMGAVQPFISGAISKTVNLPRTSVDEVAGLFTDAWKLGVKAIAIYRDNCKVAQPLSKKSETAASASFQDRARIGSASPMTATRSVASSASATTRATSTLPCRRRHARRHLRRHRQGGHDLAGLMNSFMISVSLGLQYGVPLEVYVSKFAHMRFEPSGLTNDADIRAAKSFVDYIFRWMGRSSWTQTPSRSSAS